MKLDIEIGGKIYAAEFAAGNGMARITIDGKIHEAAVSEPEPGIFVVLINERVYSCVIDQTPAGQTEIHVNHDPIQVSVFDRKRFTGGSAGAASHGRASLTAPMPGKVVRIMVKVGDAVAAHQGIMVVEAMKMQNEVQSPKDGTMTEIRVSEGQTVNAGEVLAVID